MAYSLHGLLIGQMKKGKKSKKQEESSPFFYKTKEYGLRRYNHAEDEEAVCMLCWQNALPGGRPFPLIPEQGAVSFGRIVTGPFARAESRYFCVAEHLKTGKIIGYATGASGNNRKTPDGTVAWMTWRDDKAEEIALEEFGGISKDPFSSAGIIRKGEKYLYTTSLGPRAIAFLLHARKHRRKEMPRLAPGCPEYHFQTAKKHRGKGVGTRLIIHFLEQLPEGGRKKVCMQVTVCEASKSVKYYTSIKYKGERIWKVYDRKETDMYTKKEKKRWGLGPVVENVTLIADGRRLLRYLESTV